MVASQSSLAGLEREVEKWLAESSGSANEDLIADMLRTVIKLVGDETSRGDLKILNRALKELRQAFRIFAPYSSLRKVSVFGSTRVAEDHPYYALARTLGGRLADAGFMVITGAGPGIMQAAHEGAGPEKSFGVNIRLPSVQPANRFIKDDPKLMSFHFFFARKLMFVKEADAVVIFPGGFGTHDELTEAITLAQTGKSQLVPIILVDLPDNRYWQGWQSFLHEAMVAPGYINEEELCFFKIMDDMESVVKEIKNYYHNYHSYRFVKQDLVIRLNYPPQRGLIETLNREFKDILSDGIVRQTEPLPGESDDPETLHLHRLAAHFNRHAFARLRQMIDVINRYD
jgi:uncharacterized protein (TIGR00730 family)